MSCQPEPRTRPRTDVAKFDAVFSGAEQARSAAGTTGGGGLAWKRVHRAGGAFVRRPRWPLRLGPCGPPRRSLQERLRPNRAPCSVRTRPYFTGNKDASRWCAKSAGRFRSSPGQRERLELDLKLVRIVIATAHGRGRRVVRSRLRVGRGRLRVQIGECPDVGLLRRADSGRVNQPSAPPNGSPASPSCSGGGGLPTDVGDNGDSGVCPVCGGRIRLGYAGLLPRHEPKPATAT